MFFDNINSKLMEKALDGLQLRHQAILSNVANAETPGYKKQVIDFENALQQAVASNDAGANDASQLKQTNTQHFNTQGQIGNPENTTSIERTPIEYRQDHNGVDIEAEMVNLSKNTQRYMAISRMEGKYFEELRRIINSSPQ